MGSYRKGLTLSLGSIVQTQVDLQAIIPAKRSGLRLLCPEHHIPLKQQYRCYNDEEGHVVTEAVKGAQVPEGWKIVQEGDRPQHLATKGLELIPVPAKDLDSQTVLGSGFYYCQPSSTIGLESWAVFQRILSKGKVALIARGALRQGAEKIWRLTVFRDYLALQELVFPEEIRSTPEQVDVKVSRPVQQLVDQFVDQLLVDWDKFDSKDHNKEEIQKWLDAGELVEVDTNLPVAGDLQTQVAKVIDLQAALKEAVDKAKAK